MDALGEQAAAAKSALGAFLACAQLHGLPVDEGKNIRQVMNLLDDFAQGTR